MSSISRRGVVAWASSPLKTTRSVPLSRAEKSTPTRTGRRGRAGSGAFLVVSPGRSDSQSVVPLSSSRIGARATLDVRRARCYHRRGRWRIPPEVPDAGYSVFGPYPLADHVHFAKAVAADNDARVGPDYTPPSNRSTSPTAVGTSCAGLSSPVDAGTGSGGDPYMRCRSR